MTQTHWPSALAAVMITISTLCSGVSAQVNTTTTQLESSTPSPTSSTTLTTTALHTTPSSHTATPSQAVSNSSSSPPTLATSPTLAVSPTLAISPTISSSSITQQSSTMPAITDPTLAPAPATSPTPATSPALTVSSKLPTPTPPPHYRTHSDAITFGLAGTIVTLGVIILLLTLALTLALIQNYKLKKLTAASKISQTYDEVSIIPNYSAGMSVSSVSTPSNNSISKDGFNQGYDRLLQHHHSRSSTPRLATPRRTPLEYELPVISNIATNSHTALNISTESINNTRNNGYGSLAFHKLHTAQAARDYEIPVSSLTNNTLHKTVSNESMNNDLFTSQAYDTVLLSPLPSGVYDYISQDEDEDVTMVIDLESESERLRHASTRTYEEVDIYNDIAQTEK